MKKIFSLLLGIAVFLAVFTSCKDFLDTSPTSEIPTNAISNLNDAQRVANGMYSRMKWADYWGAWMYCFGELRADDIRSRTEVSGFIAIYQYNFSTGTSNYGDLWARAYNILFNANSLLEIIDNFPVNSQGDIDKRNDLKGQALAVKGLCHFDIAKMYGYPYQMNNGASLGAVIADEVITLGQDRPRATVKETYDVIIKNLTEALPLLSRARNHGHFNYWSAKALLARVYLYMGDYENAFRHADEIITTTGSTYTLISNSDYVASWTRPNNSEMMLELLVTVQSNLNDNYGVDTYFIGLTQHPDSFSSGYLYPTATWLALMDEDPDDVRRQLIQTAPSGQRWVHKFKGNSVIPLHHAFHNPVLFRLSEVYLIAAEAALMKPSRDQAKADQYLDVIRRRANPNTTLVTATVDEVLKERRKELWGEGHRFFDLSRLGRMIDRTGDHVLPPPAQKFLVVNPWDPIIFNQTVLPISSRERLANPMAQQNPGYAEN